MATAYAENMTEALTYWAPMGNDGYGGVTYGNPVSLTGRWQDKRVLFRDAQGREVVSDAVVYVDQVLELAGKLYRGTSAALNPVSDAKEIRDVQQSPGLDGAEVLHKVLL